MLWVESNMWRRKIIYSLLRSVDVWCVRIVLVQIRITISSRTYSWNTIRDWIVSWKRIFSVLHCISSSRFQSYWFFYCVLPIRITQVWWWRLQNLSLWHLVLLHIYHSWMQVGSCWSLLVTMKTWYWAFSSFLVKCWRRIFIHILLTRSPLFEPWSLTHLIIIAWINDRCWSIKIWPSIMNELLSHHVFDDLLLSSFLNMLI